MCWVNAGKYVALSQAGPGPLPMMRHCPHKQNTDISMAALSPEMILDGKGPWCCDSFRRLQAERLGSNQHKTHSPRMLTNSRIRSCAESGTEKS